MSSRMRPSDAEVCPSGKRPAEEAAERDAPRVEFFGGTPQPRRQVGSRVS
jgi:hypothetical protein